MNNHEFFQRACLKAMDYVDWHKCDREGSMLEAADKASQIATVMLHSMKETKEFLISEGELGDFAEKLRR